MADLELLERLEGTRPYQLLRLAMNRRLVNFLRRRALHGLVAARTAEMACGSGFAAHLFAQEPNVALSLAADLNLDDYHQAAVRDYQGAFVLMDMFRPGLAPASMDLVWNSSSVEELPDPEQAVRAMAWLAKPGGRVFVGVPFKYGPAGLLSRMLSQRARSWLGRMYTRQDLRLLMDAAGLRVETELTYLAGTFIGMLGIKPT